MPAAVIDIVVMMFATTFFFNQVPLARHRSTSVFMFEKIL